MDDKRLNDLLKWSINASTQKEDNTTDAAPVRSPNADAIAALLGGPSDADLMVAAMQCAVSADPEVTLESKLTALDNMEQLIESLDNANLLSKLGLWSPLLGLLAHEEADVRRMAAWVVGTAVQNNEPSQERLVALGGLEKIVAMTAAAAPTEPEKKDVRRKAVYALSSACRNYQPAMDVVSRELAKREGKEADKVDAKNMDAVDVVIDALREKVMSAEQ
ncbi:hsp70-like protein [Pestalotiopsis sp. NC0098]|nr:hsp70-like protein [Pestalotiopsis sp. NC0098]